MVIPILRERGASCPRRMPDPRPCTTARMRSSSHAVHAGRRRKKSPRQAPRPHAPSTANLNPPKRHEQGKHGGGRGPEAHSVLRPRQGSHRSRSGMRLSRRCFIYSSTHGAHQISDQRPRCHHRLRWSPPCATAQPADAKPLCGACCAAAKRTRRRITGATTWMTEETQRLARLYERKHAALEAWKKSLLHQAITGAL